jgi:hypothetical protein
MRRDVVLDGEVERRAEVVGIVPDAAAVDRLAGLCRWSKVMKRPFSES